MKKKLAYKIYSCFAGVIGSLASFLFLFIEGRMLFAGDYIFMDNPALEIVSSLFRILFFLFLLALSVAVFVRSLLSKIINFVLFVTSYIVLIGAFASYAYYNYLAYLIVSLSSVLLCASTSLGFFLLKKTNKNLLGKEEKEIA